MGLLDGKNALIFGVANKNSIAWGIVQKLHEEGANIALSYAGEALEKRVRPLAEAVDCTFVEQCDVTNDDELDAVFDKYAEEIGTIDILVHSVAYAPKEDLDGRMVDVSRDGFLLALNVSAYSLIAMIKRAEPLMPESGGSIMSMTYHASRKVMVRYNAMAVAKAALETVTQYLAADLGPKNIRVNAISAGPIKTLAAAGIPGFRKMLKMSEEAAPMRRLVTQEEVGKTAVWLASDWSSAVTGEVIYVDGGYHVLGMTLTEEQRDEMM